MLRTCAQNPCKNGATCVSDTLGYFYGCFCSTGYIGTFCDSTCKTRVDRLKTIDWVLKNKKIEIISFSGCAFVKKKESFS